MLLGRAFLLAALTGCSEEKKGVDVDAIYSRTTITEEERAENERIRNATYSNTQQESSSQTYSSNSGESAQQPQITNPGRNHAGPEFTKVFETRTGERRAVDVDADLLHRRVTNGKISYHATVAFVAQFNPDAIYEDKVNMSTAEAEILADIAHISSAQHEVPTGRIPGERDIILEAYQESLKYLPH